MNAVVAWAAVAVLAVMGGFQAAGAAGLPVGRFLWGGRHRVLPRGRRIGSAVSLVFYAVLAGLLLWRAGVLGVRDSGFVHVATWVLVGYFALGVLMNAVSRSPAERAVMTPACVALAGASLVLAVS